jgi:hypothetical protein
LAGLVDAARAGRLLRGCEPDASPGDA